VPMTFLRLRFVIDTATCSQQRRLGPSARVRLKLTDVLSVAFLSTVHIQIVSRGSGSRALICSPIKMIALGGRDEICMTTGPDPTREGEIKQEHDHDGCTYTVVYT
jgi:hypothetical protein